MKLNACMYIWPCVALLIVATLSIADDTDSEWECSVDVEFVKEEQGFSRIGFVPTNSAGEPLSRTGVNIGYGADIGTNDADYFRGLGVSEDTIALFEPYFGLTGRDALEKVNETRLELPEDEAKEISEKYLDQQIDELSALYDAAVDDIGGDLIDFGELTVSQKTIIVDVYYQYGGNPTSRFPTYWRYVTNQQWNNVLAELRNFRDLYTPRRLREADLLEYDMGTVSLCSGETIWDCLVNKDFIREQQGFSPMGNVPTDSEGNPLGLGGVNVGYGINIGARDVSYFKALGLSDDVISQLEPYFGLTGVDAADKLMEIPLDMNSEDAADMSTRVLDQHIQEVAALYNAKIAEIGGDLLDFDELTVSQKTAIVDVYYQYGGPPETRFPTYWRYVTNQEWSNALSELRNFGDSYPTRRNDDGDLLEYDSGRVSTCEEPSIWDCLLYKDFIKKREGFVKDGYVPMNNDGTVMGQSGVQFGYGVNLGGLSEDYFRDLGVSEEIISRFRPYIGLKKEAAVEKLDEMPLILTLEESQMISDLVMDQHISEVAELYDDKIQELGNADLKTFANLTIAQKTVIADVFYQYGGPPTTRFPRYWGFVTTQVWDDAIGELRDFGDAYSTRRNQEANLLESDNGEISLCPEDDINEDRDDIEDWDCDVDKPFIRQLDEFSTNGYVPTGSNGDPLSSSGVVIGAAIDLGSKNSDYFRESGVSEEIIVQLLPYLGHKGIFAFNKTIDQPLVLTEDDAVELTDRVLDRFITDVSSVYNARVEQLGGNLKEYSALTVAQKSVIASVYYQYGGPPVLKYPTYWGFVTTQEWDAALAELKDFRDRFPTRRNKEADYLESDSGETTLCPEPTPHVPGPVSSGRLQAEMNHIGCVLLSTVWLFIFWLA